MEMDLVGSHEVEGLGLSWLTRQPLRDMDHVTDPLTLTNSFISPPIARDFRLPRRSSLPATPGHASLSSGHRISLL